MKTLTQSAILISQLLLPLAVLANPPVKYPACAKDLRIKAVANGSGVYFDEKCDVAYVLPPQQGRLEIKGLAPNMNLQLCSAYESTLNMLKNQYSHLELITKQLNATADQNSSDTSIDGNTSIDGSGSSASAPQLKPVDPRLIEEFQKTMSLIALTQQSMQVFENDKKGVAVGKINYFTDWNKLVSEYQKANPQIHFERLPLDAGRIVFSRKVGASSEIVTGAVAQSIQGIENTSGISADGTLNPGSGSVIMGDAISGQIVLNFAGACPFIKNGKMPQDLSTSEVDAYLAANFQYKFSLQSLKKYRASYNLASIAKHIVESRKSGGFFSSSTTNSVIDSNSSNDEFNMVISSDQAGYEYDSNLRAEVKMELIGRVLREMGDITGQPVNIPTLTAPGAHGSTVLAGQLQKVPNIYAQVGAVTLKVLDSIFGNSNAVASYIRTKNGVSVDDVTEKRMFHYNGSMVFSGSQK